MTNILNKKNIILHLIILLAIFLRVNYDLFTPGYIFDELAMVSLVKTHSLIEIIKNIANLDYHAPLYYLVASIFTNFDNEWIHLRFLNLIFSILNIYVFYLIGKNIKNKNLGYILAILLAVNHIHISITSFVKFYCLCFLILSLIILNLIKILKFKNNYKQLGILNALFCLSTTFGFVFVFIEYLFLYLRKRKNKKQLPDLLISFIISMFGFVLYLPIFVIQAQ